MDVDNNTSQPLDSSEDDFTMGGDNPMDEFESLLAESFDYTPPHRGEIRKAIIMQIKHNEIIVDLGAKQDGLVTSQDLEHLDDEIRATLEVGQEIPVYILQPRDRDGNLIVSINMGLQQFDWEEAAQLLKDDEVVDVRITGHNRGGVLVRWKRLEGFIPSSHMTTVNTGLQGMDRKSALSDIEGDKLTVKIIEVDPSRRRLIFSEREAQREWRAQQKARLLDELGEGDVVKGTVTGLRDFGAFVNLGGADGLIHVSELAWHRIDHPRDVLEVGQEIDVFILNLDRETNRIALSRKRLLNDPWDDAIERYHEGQLVEGMVTNVVDFGAFIALDDGLEGLLHLSEMGDGTLKEPHSYVKKGDRLQLRISRLEPDRRRVGFTQRWGTEQPVLEDEEGDEVLDEAPPEAEADMPDDVIEDSAEDEADMPDDVAEDSAEVEADIPDDVAEDSAEAEADIPDDVAEDSAEAEADIPDDVAEDSAEAEADMPDDVVEDQEEE